MKVAEAEQVTLTLSAAACYPVWLALRADAEKRRRNGGSVRPEVAEALDALRAAAQIHLGSANVRNAGLAADIRTGSSQDLTTGDLAAQLGVCERHARRLAHSAGVRSVARGLWRREDAAALVARRKRR
jgi:hypothetical protein